LTLIELTYTHILTLSPSMSLISPSTVLSHLSFHSVVASSSSAACLAVLLFFFLTQFLNALLLPYVSLLCVQAEIDTVCMLDSSLVDCVCRVCVCLRCCCCSDYGCLLVQLLVDVTCFLCGLCAFLVLKLLVRSDCLVFLYFIC